MEPKVHIPRVLKTNQYQKVMHRDFHIPEIIELKKTDEFINSLTNKERSIKALAQTIYFNLPIGEQLSQSILKKTFSMVNRNDLSELERAFTNISMIDGNKPKDLLSELSEENRKMYRVLLLEKRIITHADLRLDLSNKCKRLPSVDFNSPNIS